MIAGVVFGPLSISVGDFFAMLIKQFGLGEAGSVSAVKSGATWDRVLPVVLLMSIAVRGLLTLARLMNCLLLGEADAAWLGVEVEKVKARAALFTAIGGALVLFSDLVARCFVKSEENFVNENYLQFTRE